MEKDTVDRFFFKDEIKINLTEIKELNNLHYESMGNTCYSQQVMLKHYLFNTIF